MPGRRRPPTAAEMAHVNAGQYEFIGGPPPSGKPKGAKPADSGPPYVYLIVDASLGAGRQVLSAFTSAEDAAKARAAANAQGGRSRLSIQAVRVDGPAGEATRG